LLRYGHHPNIVTLRDVYEDERYVYLVMSMLRGGELLERILHQRVFSEKEAAHVIHVVASTLQYLHHNGVSNIIL